LRRVAPGTFGNLDANHTINSLDFEGFEAIEDGTLLLPSSFDREGGVVKRADEFVPDEETLLEVEAEMRTFALGGINLTLIVDDQDGVLGLWANEDLANLTLSEVILSLQDLDVLTKNSGAGEP